LNCAPLCSGRQYIVEFGTFREDYDIVVPEAVTIDTALLTTIQHTTQNDFAGREVTSCNQLTRVTAGIDRQTAKVDMFKLSPEVPSLELHML
jgi:hypothetical protein